MVATKPDLALALLSFGITGPVVYATLVVTLGVLDPAHSPVRDSMSELGAVDASYPMVMNVAGFMVLGAAILAFAAGYRLRLRPGLAVDVGTGLLVLAGVFMVAVGFFPCDPGCVDITTRGRLHSLTSIPQAIALPSAALVSTRVFRADGRLGTRWQLFSFWAGISALATGPLVGLDLISGAAGAVQRFGMGLSLAWMVAVGLRLRDLQPAQQVPT